MKDVKISEMLVRDCEDGRREYYHLLTYFDGYKNITIESTGVKNYKDIEQETYNFNRGMNALFI